MTLISENRSLLKLSTTLIVVLLIGSYLQYLDQPLTIPASTKGMISFQLAGNEQDEIAGQWQKLNLTHIAVLQLEVDFLFVIAYTYLLWQLLARTFPSPASPVKDSLARDSDHATKKFRTNRKLLVSVAKGLIILGALMDVLENITCLASLWWNWHSFALTRILTYGKFIALGLVAVAILLKSLRWFSAVITQIMNGIWLFRLVVFGLLLTYLVLWVMDQGQDLLLSVTSNPLGPIVTLSVLSLLAACNWYLPKYYQLPDKNKLTVRNFFFSSWDYEMEEHTEYTFTGRLLGAFTLMLPGACILHAMQVFQVRYWLEFIQPETLMIILLIFYYLILKYQWLCDQKTVLSIAIIVFTLMVAFGVWAYISGSLFLAYFALDFLMLSFVFLLYTNVRKTITKWSIFNTPITPFVTFPALAVSVIFIYENINPLLFAFEETARFLTLAVVFSSVVFYVFLITVLLLLGKKYKIQILTSLVILMLALGNVIPNNYHRIRFYAYQEHGEKPVQMDSLSVYTVRWLQKRLPELENFNTQYPYPIFVINAPGGGIRAAAWTSKVINALDTAVSNTLPGDNVNRSKNDFQHHVFAYSCSSGGTLGAAVLCAERYNNLSRNGAIKVTGDFYKRDFLTPVFIQLFGRDLWFAFAGSADISDRAAQQEKVWEKQARRYATGLHLDGPLSQYWYDQGVPYEVPLLFANSYLLETGQKAVIAPVLLSSNDFPASFLMSNYLSRTTKNALTLRLSTAALLTARFPFISPAGKLDGFKHFLDGGFTENSGAETADQVRQVLQKTVDSMGLKEKVRITMLSLPNTASAVDSTRTAKNLFEIGAPLTGAINTSVGNTHKAERLLVLRSKVNGYETASIRPMARDEKPQSLTPLLPLGWQVSDSALNYMDRSIRYQQNRETMQWLVSKIEGK